MRLPEVLKTRRAVYLALGLVGVVIVWAAGPPLLRRVEFFQVRRVEILGSRYLPGEEIVARMGLEEGASIFDPVEPLAARVFAMIGVREVSIRRRLPGTLRVSIRESDPVALSLHEGKLVLVDERGWVLPFDPTRSPADLPLASADSLVTGLLARLRQADPERFAEVISAVRARDHVVLETENRRLLMRADASAEEILDMAAVAAELARQGREYRELDGRFVGRVFVRGMGA